MKDMELTSQEIMYLAAACRKDKVYAVDNLFLQMPEEDIGMEKQKALDALLQKGLMQMDFDGDICPSADAKKLIDFLSDCSAFSLLTFQDGAGGYQKKIAWKLHDEFLLSDEKNGIYRMNPSLADAAATDLQAFFCWDTPECDVGESVTVPQLDLKKAKRHQKTEDYDAALRVLRQAGITGKMAETVVASLFEKTSFYSAVYVNLDRDEPSAESCMFSCGEFGYLQMCPAVENYRSTAVFTMTTKEILRNAVNGIIQAFVKTEGCA